MSTRARHSAGDDLDDVAAWVQRLASLLAAGLEPLAAVRALETLPPELAAAAQCDSPFDVPARIVETTAGSQGMPRLAWMLLAAAWSVALESGAPLAASLDRTAGTLRSLADADRQVDLAIAGPIATSRIVALLPLLGLGLGFLMGADPIGVIVGTIPGAVAAVAGLALLVAGTRWNRRLVATARENDPLAGLGPELLALAMEGGGDPDRALELAGDAIRRCRIRIDLDDAEATLAFARRAGVSVAALLRTEAARMRRLALAGALRRAALLGSRLLGPLAVCFLPSFVLLGVVPLIIGILRGAIGSFVA